MNNGLSSNKKTALCGVLIALALILSYLESLFPLTFAVPGIKLGLANIVTIVALFKLGIRMTVIISLGRVILASVLFGNPMTLVYSLAGVVLSIVVMSLINLTKLFSETGISVCGAVSHNLGQLIVAAVLLENTKIMYYMAVLAISGTFAGVIIGILSAYIIRNIKI